MESSKINTTFVNETISHTTQSSGNPDISGVRAPASESKESIVSVTSATGQPSTLTDSTKSQVDTAKNKTISSPEINPDPRIDSLTDFTDFVNLQSLNDEERQDLETKAAIFSGFSSEFAKFLINKNSADPLTKKCSVKLFNIDANKSGEKINMEAKASLVEAALPPRKHPAEDNPPKYGGTADNPVKRDIEPISGGGSDGPVVKKPKSDDIIVLDGGSSNSTSPEISMVKMIKPSSSPKDNYKSDAGRPSDIKSKMEKHSKPLNSSDSGRKSSDGSNSNNTGSNNSNNVSNSQSNSKTNSTKQADNSDRTSLRDLEARLMHLQQKAAQDSKPKPKNLSPSVVKTGTKDNHHRRPDHNTSSFSLERKKSGSSSSGMSPVKPLKPKKHLSSPSSGSVRDNSKLGTVFTPSNDSSKVTILPCKTVPKDGEHKLPSVGSNSVTITKVSSGDSLNVSSKDIKKVFSPKSENRTKHTDLDPNSLFKPDKVKVKSLERSEKSPKDAIKVKDKEYRPKDKDRGGRVGSLKIIRCSKCREVFSTKEAKKLHTCNSILDAHFLIDGGDRQKTSPVSNSSTSDRSESTSASLSRSSSRSSSPGIPFPSSSKKSESPKPFSMSSMSASSKIVKKLDEEKFSRVKISINKLKTDEDDDKNKERKIGDKPVVKKDPMREKWIESKRVDSSNSIDSSNKSRVDSLVLEHGAGGNLDMDKESAMFAFSGKRTYSPSMTESQHLDGKVSPRETNNKDSPASQADSGIFSIASSASPSKVDGGTDIRSPGSPRIHDTHKTDQWKLNAGSTVLTTSSADNKSATNCVNNSSASKPGMPGNGFPTGITLPINTSITRVASSTNYSINTSSMQQLKSHVTTTGQSWSTSQTISQSYYYDEKDKKQKSNRGRPRKNGDLIFSGKGKISKAKTSSDEDKDMYDFEMEEDEDKPVQPLRPRRQNAQPVTYKDPDSDEDAKGRIPQVVPLIQATQGYKDIHEKSQSFASQHFNSMSLSVDNSGHDDQLDGDEKDKNVLYKCSTIEETATGGIKLKIKIKKSASPMSADIEPPLKKSKIEESSEVVVKSEPSIVEKPPPPMLSNNPHINIKTEIKMESNISQTVSPVVASSVTAQAMRNINSLSQGLAGGGMKPKIQMPQQTTTIVTNVVTTISASGRPSVNNVMHNSMSMKSNMNTTTVNSSPKSISTSLPEKRTTAPSFPQMHNKPVSNSTSSHPPAGSNNNPPSSGNAPMNNSQSDMRKMGHNTNPYPLPKHQGPSQNPLGTQIPGGPRHGSPGQGPRHGSPGQGPRHGLPGQGPRHGSPGQSPRHGSPGQGQPGHGPPGQGLPGQRPSGQGLSGQGLLGQGLSGQRLTGQGTPGQVLPGQRLPSQSLSGQGPKGQEQPGQGLPRQGLPGQGIPGQGPPGQGPPGKGPPGQGSSGKGPPGQGLPGQEPPGQGPTGQGLPGQGPPGQGPPGQGPPSQGLPGQGPPGQGPPGQGPPGQGPPGQGPPGQGPLGQGPPGQGPPGQGLPGQGPLGQGPLGGPHPNSLPNQNNFEMQRQFPGNNFMDMTSYSSSYANYSQQQHMYSSSQYQQHMSAFRPGIRPGNMMSSRPQQPGPGGYMPSRIMDPRFQQNMGDNDALHHPGGISPHQNSMGMQGMMSSHMGMGMRHPSMMGGMHPGMGNPNMPMNPFPGGPGMSQKGMGMGMGLPNGGQMMNSSVMNPLSSAGNIIPRAMSPHTERPLIGPPAMSPSSAPGNDRGPMFPGGQYRLNSPQYSPHHQSQTNFNQSPSYSGPQGYPNPSLYKPPTPQTLSRPPTPQQQQQQPYNKPSTPQQQPNYQQPQPPQQQTYPQSTTPQHSYPKPPTPQSYPQPLTPQNPSTPGGSFSQNPSTPGGSYSQNPSTPGGSYPNPSTPGTYHNPTTPVSQQNPLTPQSFDPQTPGGSQHNNSFDSPTNQPVMQSNPNTTANNFVVPKQETPMQPSSSNNVKVTTPPMLSPPSTTSSLRNVRIPPKKSVTPGTTSPGQKNLSPNTLDSHVSIKAEPMDVIVPKSEPVSSSPLQSPKSEPPQIPSIKQEAPPSPPPPVIKAPEEIKKEEPPPKPATPEPVKALEPPKDPRWGEDGPEGMPERALRLIFSYVCHNDGCLPFLPNMMRVCKLWHKVASKSELWTHANLGSAVKEKLRTEKKLEWILSNKFPNAVHVDLTSWKAVVSTPALRIVAATCPKITGLGLSNCVKLNYEDIRIVPSLFPKLQRVDLSLVSPSTASSRSAVSSTALSDLITSMGENLTHFNMSSNKMAGLPFVFKALSQHSKNLRFLDVSNISTTSRDTILINIEKLQKGCPLLTTFRTTNTMLGLNDTPVREQVMSPGFPMLEELTIGVDQRGYFDGMDDQQIERILKKSPKLRLLNIRGCKGISDSTLVRLPCWDLEYLYVAGCSVTSSSRDGLELLVKKWCRTLIELDIGLTSDQKTVDWAVIALVENEEDLKLRKLNLTGTAVSLKPLTKLLNCCPTLASLNLTSCRALPRGMKRMYHSRDDVQGLAKDIADGKFDARDAGSDDD